MKMNAVISCPCRQNNLNKNEPPCRFVEIFDKLPECPCSCIPSINAGPPCPFKSSAPCMPSPVQCILQGDQSRSESGGCPLSSSIRDGVNSSFSDQSQLCVFAEAKPINFKEWPPFQCSCVPGTCPEISKNLLRSWGFDPMCNCPCSSVSAAALAAETSKIASDSIITKVKSKSLSKTNLKSASRTVSIGDVAGLKDNKPPRDRVTVGYEGSSTKLSEGSAKHVAVEDYSETYDEGPPGGKLITRGKGFKIYEINGEKVLFNYSTKNCKWLKCECSKKAKSCGCDEWKRMINYRNCCCPGAKKQRKIPPKPSVKDLRPSLHQTLQTPSQDEQKTVKYSTVLKDDKNENDVVSNVTGGSPGKH